MSLSLRSILIPGVSWLALLCGNANAREIEDWPYDKLFKHSELVVIVNALEVREAKKEDRAKPPAKYLTGVVTTFDVLHVVKGKQEKKKLEIIHFRLDYGASINNGPKLVTFHTGALTVNGVTNKDYAYMLFLRKGKDGRLTFVSGQIDTVLSVKQILRPLRK
jgi:hypothetical protein